MKVDLIGKRIRQARERVGLSQRELANLMGWKSHASLVAIESGTQDIKTWELLKFANILQVNPEALYKEESNELLTTPQQILWRNRSLDPEIAKKEELNVIQHCEDYRLIKRLLFDCSSKNQIKQLPCEQYDISKSDALWANQLAERMYREFNLGDFPAYLLARRLEEDYGVLLMSSLFENGSAACCRGEWGAAIVLSRKEVAWRHTFNIAHELFHLVTWSQKLIEEVYSNACLFEKNEKLANSFAAALLMPSNMIYIDASGSKLTYAFVVALARKYSVSTEALLWRLCHLRFLSRANVEKTLADAEFRQLDRESTRQVSQPASFDNRFLRLAYLAFEKGRLSKGRLAQMLDVKFRDVDLFLAEKGLFLTNDKEIATNRD